MKIRGRFTGAVAATMRQQFACSAFRSRTSILFRVIGNVRLPQIPAQAAGSDKCVCCMRPGTPLSRKDNGGLHLTRKD